MKENASKLEVQINMILNNKKKKTINKSPKKNIKTSCKKKNDNEEQNKMPMVTTPIHGYITWCFNNLSRKIDELPQKILKMLLSSPN
jgi:hypothetical protein